MAKLSQLDGSNGFRLVGFDLYDYSGCSVAGAGDVNGDGIDDLIIGAKGAGASYVVFGTAAGFGSRLRLFALDGSNGFRFDGRGGSSVAGAGDVNGDGIDDLIIGAPYVGDGYGGDGESYVLFGSAAGFAAEVDLAALDGSNGFRLDGIDDYDNSGFSVAGAGDVNGDGIDDVIIGAPYADPGSGYGAGASYVVFGSAAGFGRRVSLSELDGNNGFRLGGIDDSDNSGRSVAGAGDINGDGIDDLIIGAPRADSGDRYDAGESYVVFGSSAGFGRRVRLAALDGSNGFRLVGIDDQDSSGFSVASAGDVNGDGIDDLIIGAAYADVGDHASAGESFVVFGSVAGFAAEVDLAALDGSNGFRLAGIDDYDNSGFSVAGAGDVNGDGIDDLIIGALRADSGGDYAGASYVVFGSATGFAAELDLAALDGSNGFRLDGIDAGDLSGSSVGGAGDVNGDGIDDLIIGAPHADRGEQRIAGKSYVVFGSTQLGGANDAPSAADDTLQVRTLDVIDLAADNGAGSDHDPDLDDLAITSIDGTPVSTGESVTLASGLRVTVVGSTEVRFDAPGTELGALLSDALVYEVSDGRGGSDSATVTVDYAHNAVALAALDGGNGFRVAGIDKFGNSGRSVAGAGDVNGDGIDDLIIGTPGASPGGKDSAGKSYVVFGSPAGFEAALDLAALNGSNGFRLVGIDDRDYSGFSVAGAGDVNGDGINDLIVGAFGANPRGRHSGESYIVFGSSAGFGRRVRLSELDGSDGFRLDGTDADDHSGFSVAGAGDVNGDGIDDLIVGAHGGDPGDRSYAGESFVVFGSSAGFGSRLKLSKLDGSNGFRLVGIDAYDESGRSVAGAGDVNGDGIDDLIIGAPRADSGSGYAAGASYVVFGSSNGFGRRVRLSELDGSNGFRLDGIDAYDKSGWSVAGAGDVNRDGIDDLIIGAYSAGVSTGESYVVFGSSAGFGSRLKLSRLDGSNGFHIAGIDTQDTSGYSVAGAGDVNGDGIDDLIIGAPRADPGGYDVGATYVVFGSSSGFGKRVRLSELDGRNGFRLDGIAEQGYSGFSVASAGDVNGDGLDDLIIGAQRAEDDTGESYVVFGFRTDQLGTTSSSVSSVDAEQSTATAQIELGPHEFEIGETAKKLVGLHFTGLDIPDGPMVTEASTEFEAADSDACAARITIALEDSRAAATYGQCADRSSARDYLDETASWTPEPRLEGGLYRTADLTATIAAPIGTEGHDPDEALAFRFTGTGDREAASVDSAGAAPTLVIEFEGVPALPSGRSSGLTLRSDAPADCDDPRADGLTGIWNDCLV